MKYETDIVLGKKYVDEQTGIEGTAVALTFFQHGCERVTLEWSKENAIHEYSFDAPRLTGKESERTGGPEKYSSHTRPGAARR